jgi:HrpA-like RNA helicase
MAELGISEFERFEFISAPAKSGIAGAIDALSLLGALNPDRSLTKVGEMMCAFPLLPRHSRIIVEAILVYPDVIDEVLIAASFLSTMSPYILPPGEEMEARRAHHAFRDPAGDFISYLKIFAAFKAARDGGRWCVQNYLDERTLLEIVRIKEQLELIVSDLGVPISGGGSVDDYLCCVGRGLIQFVCVRQERGLFRSLTAEKIQIHPGSVMYKENPQYLVAGEIVRTTRMYAMSVSPLRKDMLSRISPRLEALMGRGPIRSLGNEAEKAQDGSGRQRGARRAAPTVAETAETASNGARRRDRDFTNKIKIASEVFELATDKKKKKVVELEWPRLKKVREEVDRDSLALYKGLKGVVLLGRQRLLDGERLDLILKVSPWLDLEADLAREWPRKRNFAAKEELGALIEALGHVMQVSRARDKTGELGFVALFTDAEGTYWFRCSRGFHTALNESVASLESLIDELGENTSETEREKVSSLYRKLSSFFE